MGELLRIESDETIFVRLAENFRAWYKLTEQNKKDISELLGRGYSERDIAKRIGVGKGTIHRLAKGAPVGRKSTNDLGELPPTCEIRHCSMQDLFASGVRVDVVITDPPYPAEFLPLFSDLAIECRKAEVPLVAVMSGQYHLPKVLSLMGEHLRYRWTLAYMTPGQKTVVFGAQVNTGWKPILLFGAKDAMLPTDVVTSETPDKDHHEWGQSESGMAGLISLLSRPGDLVCDPFLGAGTTAVEAIRAGRRFVGCDIDEDCVKRSIARCAEAMNERGTDGDQVLGDIEAAQDVGAGPPGLGP